VRQARAAEQAAAMMDRLAPLGPLSVELGGSGADIGLLRDAGFPLMGFRVEGSTYFDYHHSHADTLDKVNPRDLSDCVAVMAATAYLIADMPQRLGQSES